MQMTNARAMWAILAGLTAGCGGEPAEVREAAVSEPAAPGVQAEPLELEPVLKYLQATREAMLAGGRDLDLDDLSEDDRKLLEEYSAIRAKYAADADARPVEAVAPPDASEPVEAALFGLQTREHRL